MKLKTLLIWAAWMQGSAMVSSYMERNEKYRQATEASEQIGKPLLVVGGPAPGFKKNFLIRLFKYPRHGCGDVCVDIDIGACSICGAEVEKVEADIRSIPYPPKTFGAAFASHVLEHLPTADDAARAVQELYRVAHEVFIVSPSKRDLVAWIHPDHYLWVKHNEGGYYISERRGHQKDIWLYFDEPS